MTISSSTRKAGPFLGNGVTSSFPFTFKCFSTSDIQIIKTSILGVDFTLILNSDYSVSLNGDQNASPGGTITYPLSGALLQTGEKLTATGVLSALQQTHITNGGNFFANNIEDQMDYLTILVQQLAEQMSRVALASSSDVNPVLSIGTAVQRALKYITFDALGNLSLAQSLPSGTLSQAVIGQFLNPQTPGELAAGVVPINYGYLARDIDRYATNTTPGTTSMRAALQAAINVAKQDGGDVTVGNTGVYLIDGAIDGTTPVGSNVQGFRIIGKGRPNANTSGAPYQPALILRTRGFDFTGNRGLELQNLTLLGDSTSPPDIGVLIARNSDKASQIVTMRDVRMIGKFGTSCVYNYGSEDDSYHGCYFENDNTASGTSCVILTGNNIKGVTSTFTTIATGPLSTIDHDFYSCQFFNAAGTATSDCIYVEASDSPKVFGGWGYSSSGTASGRSLIYVDQTNTTSNFGTIIGFTGEDGGIGHNQSFGIAFSNHAQTPSGWNIQSDKLVNATAAISAGTLTTLDNFHVKLVGASGGGLVAPGIVQQSVIDSVAMTLVIGSVPNTVLIGFRSAWTVGDYTNSFVIDSGTSTKTWTPAAGTLTHGGVLGFSTKKWLYSGNMAHFSFIMSDSVSITATLGQTITGLLAGAAAIGMVSFINFTTGAALGQGYVTGSTIVVSTPFSVGASVSVAVVGNYFVS